MSEDYKAKHYAFFQNKECEYFPCHKGIEEDRLNCLFCYCPLYMLGKECGGQFCYNEKGIKVCTNCTFPHEPEHYKKIVDRFADIAEKMKEQ